MNRTDTQPQLSYLDRQKHSAENTMRGELVE